MISKLLGLQTVNIGAPVSVLPLSFKEDFNIFLYSSDSLRPVISITVAIRVRRDVIVSVQYSANLLSGMGCIRDNNNTSLSYLF